LGKGQGDLWTSSLSRKNTQLPSIALTAVREYDTYFVGKKAVGLATRFSSIYKYTTVLKMFAYRASSTTMKQRIIFAGTGGQV
jgi:hypothetical protein